MKKRTYKRLQKLLYKEKLARLRAEDELKHVMYRIEQAEDEAKSLRKRFAEFGTNVDTSDTGNTAVRCVKWTLNPVAYGTYMAFIDDIKADTEKRIKEKLIESLIRGLVESNMVQFVYKPPRNQTPTELGTLAAKLYVVPWEQMPHGRKTIQLEEYKFKPFTTTCFTN